jgi:hypothetical protein
VLACTLTKAARPLLHDNKSPNQIHRGRQHLGRGQAYPRHARTPRSSSSRCLHQDNQPVGGCRGLNCTIMPISQHIHSPASARPECRHAASTSRVHAPPPVCVCCLRPAPCAPPAFWRRALSPLHADTTQLTLSRSYPTHTHTHTQTQTSLPTKQDKWLDAVC